MLKQRVITAIIALAVLSLVLFVVPQPVARGFVAVLIVAGAWEWAGFLFRGGGPRRWIYVIFIGAGCSARCFLRFPIPTCWTPC